MHNADSMTHTQTSDLFGGLLYHVLCIMHLVVEVPAGIEPAHRSFADSCLTAWLPDHLNCCDSNTLSYFFQYRNTDTRMMRIYEYTN